MSAHNTLQWAALADTTLRDPGDGGDIALDRTPATLEVTTVAAETRTLLDPARSGHQLMIVLDVDGGDLVITAETAINVAGNTIMTFDTAGDWIKLESIAVGGAYRWVIVENSAVALS